jgi:hypothetical protein
MPKGRHPVPAVNEVCAATRPRACSPEETT